MGKEGNPMIAFLDRHVLAICLLAVAAMMIVGWFA